MFKYYLFKVIRVLFPNGQNTKKVIILKSISLLAIIGIIVCSILWFNIEYDHYVLRRDNEKIQNVMEQIINTHDPQSEEYDFEPLYDENTDICAWINIPGTDINYPICQTDNNDYYLTHNFFGEYSSFGTLFFDFKNNIKTSQNLTVYGHSLKNSQMFTNIKNYAKLDFYKEHPIVQLFTPDGMYEYKVFAAMVMNAVPQDDNGYLYNFMQTDFNVQREFVNWINEANQRSLIQTTVDVLPNDRIITLSTCGYEFKNQRFVVMAKLIDSTTDFPAVTITKNPNPKEPNC